MQINAYFHIVSNSIFVKTVRNGLVLNSLWVRKTPVYINGTLNVTLGLLQSKIWNDLPHIFSYKNEGFSSKTNTNMIFDLISTMGA